MSTSKSTCRITGVLCLLLLSACFNGSGEPDPIRHKGSDERMADGALPRPDHVVVVVEENKSYADILDSPDAPFLNGLAAEGVIFRQYYGLTHPSEPNYLALFSGSTQGVTDDGCDYTFTGPNLASELGKAGFSFVQYSESLPHTGFPGCVKGAYVRKHNPAVYWQKSNVSPTQNRPFSDFPEHFDDLPTVAFVSPDLRHDMHDGSVQAGDRWLADHLGRYARWALHHNSLLIVTWDEDDHDHDNQIDTLMVGAMVKPGESTQLVDHHNLLRTLEAMYDLPLLGRTARARPITGVWARVDRNRSAARSN